MKKTKLLLIIFFSTALLTKAQNIQWTADQIKVFSTEWKGERDANGRPRVSDDLVKRLADISLEEAWGFMRNKGYNNQFEAGWQIINPSKALAGRVLTAQYMPSRPDIDLRIKEKGKAEARSGSPNSWPIDMLKTGDVYVADGFGKIIDGTLIGDNLGNSIYAKSKTGVVFDAGIRDLEGLEAIDGFVGFVRGFDPSYIKDVMLTCINCPIRIGRVTVMPGDLVLGKKEGVVFIPAHLAKECIENSEFVGLKDEFGHARLREGKYTPGQIDMKWDETIKADFLNWVKNTPGKLKVSSSEFDALMKDRNW
ncbi:MAG: RraA family protein [Bacteroidota bacterium]